MGAMRHDIVCSLVNGPEGDPALYADFKYERRAFLFDLGDVHGFSARSLLKVDSVFVSHTHVDHFIGFDQLLRLHLGRHKQLKLYGPAGFTNNVEAKLRGYRWNLVRNYPYDLTLEVFEAGDAGLQAARFECRGGFDRVRLPPLAALDAAPVILEEAGLRIRAALLDHDIPSLAYALEQKVQINVDKVRLEASGFSVGPWIREVKEAVRNQAPDHVPIRIPLAAGTSGEAAEIPLGELRRGILRFSRGIKVAYVTDAAYTAENRRKIVDLAGGADLLYCEAVFSDQDRTRAEQRRHLTAGQAGLLAREAGVRRLVLFHFSPKYHSRLESLYREAREAYGGEVG